MRSLSPRPRPIYHASEDPRIVIATSVKDFVRACKRPEKAPPVIFHSERIMNKNAFYYARLKEIFSAEERTGHKCYLKYGAKGIANRYGDVYVEPEPGLEFMRPLSTRLMQLHAKAIGGRLLRVEIFPYLDREPHPHEYDVTNVTIAEDPEKAGTSWFDEEDRLHSPDAGEILNIRMGFLHLTPRGNNQNRFVAVVREYT